MTTHLMNTYARQPVAFVRGEGAWLWDESGKRYLDAVAGVAVNGLGMLIHPAAHAFRRWTNEEPPLEAMSAAALGGLLHRDQNPD